ncbi:hypothetical protein NE865_04729 [Phthorimaea operculella]|nr:hypothetical protein NE865_04729 [Phthorimaea operculella]
MRALVLLGFVLFATAFAEKAEPSIKYGYHDNIGIPLGKKIYEAEKAAFEKQEGFDVSRVVGGEVSSHAAHPYLTMEEMGDDPDANALAEIAAMDVKIRAQRAELEGAELEKLIKIKDVMVARLQHARFKREQEAFVAASGTGRMSLCRSPPHTPGGTLLPQVAGDFPAGTPPGAASVLDDSLGLTAATTNKKRALPSPESGALVAKRVSSALPPIAGITGGGPQGLPGVLPPVTATNTGGNDGEGHPKSKTDDVMEWSPAQIYKACTRLCSGITRNVRANTSKLNKVEIAEIGCLTQEIQGLFMGLTIRLKEAEGRAVAAETALMASEKALAAEKQKGSQQPQLGQNPIPQMGAGPMENTTSFSSVLRMTGQASRPKPQQPGATLAIYPMEGDSQVKTADDTKALLKKSVDPQALGVQVTGLRKVGNAGVLLKINDAVSAERLKKALPETLRVAEPKERAPLVAIINVEGEVGDNDTFKSSLIAQNFEEGERENVAKNIEVAFKKWRRGGAATTVVLRCSPAIRDTLINRERVYLGWERYLCRDYVDVVCCSRCQLYGHSIKFCKATKETCGKCGAEGHNKESCTSTTTVCATCKSFNKGGAETHKTASVGCPARTYAIDRALSRVNYG